MSFAITWLTDVLQTAITVRSTSIEIARDPDGLIGKINVGEGSQSYIHTHSIVLAKSWIADLYAYLQQKTGCMRHIDLEIDRGYGRFTDMINGRTIHVDIFVHGTHPQKVMDLAIEYIPIRSTVPPPPADEAASS